MAPWVFGGFLRGPPDFASLGEALKFPTRLAVVQRKTILWFKNSVVEPGMVVHTTMVYSTHDPKLHSYVRIPFFRVGWVRHGDIVSWIDSIGPLQQLQLSTFTHNTDLTNAT